MTFVGWIRVIPVEMEEASGAVPRCLKGYITTSCTSKVGRGIGTPSPRKNAEENRFSLLLKYCNSRKLQRKVAKYPITS